MGPLRLASTSPRRWQLLESLGFALVPVAVPIEEIWPGGAPGPAAARLAQLKLAAALAVWPAKASVPTLAADTVVVLGQRVLGKPRDAHHHQQMLQALSGQRAQVITGIAAELNGHRWRRHVTTSLRFRSLSQAAIAAYVADGDGADKSGGFALQGGGGLLIARVVGSWTNVVGLPVAETLAGLAGLRRRPATKTAPA